MKLQIYNFVFETYEDPNDYYIDCDMNVINKDDLSVNPQCEVQLDHGWISIESKIPDDVRTDCLVFSEGFVRMAEFRGVDVFKRPLFMSHVNLEYLPVDYWMPLPNLPKF